MYIGTCGFPVAKKKYFEEFKVVEIQKTFYTPISKSLAQRWRENTPKDFIFTLKAPQTITHPPSSPTYRRYKGPLGDFGYFKSNEDVMLSWKNFVEIARILRAKVIVFQTPASFRQNKGNMENILNFFDNVERIATYGWEQRGKWDLDIVKKICKEADLIHVVDPFKNRSVWGEFSYYRLHGIGGYSYRYSDEDLNKLMELVKNEDYIMFNNTHMWEDAKRFKLLLESKQPGN